MSSRLAALFEALDGDLVEQTGFGVDFYRSIPFLLPDFSHSQVASFQLVHSLGKKFLPQDTSIPDQAALLKFKECNSRSLMWDLTLNTSLDETLWGTFKQVLYKFLSPGGFPLVDELDSCFLKGRCGPGSSIGASGEDFYSKMFSSRLTFSTPVLRDHYLRNVARFPEWFAAEAFRSASLQEPRFVQSSRLSFVPKTTTISRTICTEPSLNMYYQLGLGCILEARLRSFFKIDLSKQPDLNRELARLGSVSDSLATIDLESASDSISLRLCELALPREFFLTLMALRTPSCSLGDQTYTFGMISTMGNGFTFPLQTLIFASAVSAVYTTFGRSCIFGESTLESCGVFGDDIIVHSDMYDRVVRFLSLLGFKVNSSKSFSRGLFRESCGCDYYNGRNVRGVYAKSLSTPQDSYALINSLNWFTARTGLNLFRTVSRACDWCDRRLHVPASEDPSSGLQVPLSMLANRKLGYQTQAYCYVCYVAAPKRIRIGDGFIRTPKGLRKRIYNPSGLLIGFLSGMALSSGLPVRSRTVRWKKKRRYCSWWNSLPPEAAGNRGVHLRLWETAVSENLLGY